MRLPPTLKMTKIFSILHLFHDKFESFFNLCGTNPEIQYHNVVIPQFYHTPGWSKVPKNCKLALTGTGTGAGAGPARPITLALVLAVALALVLALSLALTLELALTLALAPGLLGQWRRHWRRS